MPGAGGRDRRDVGAKTPAGSGSAFALAFESTVADRTTFDGHQAK